MKDKFQLKFLDILEDDLADYEEEMKVLEKGYPMPITLIEGKTIDAGKMDEDKIYRILKRTKK